MSPVTQHLALRHLLAPLPVPEVGLVRLSSEQACPQLVVFHLPGTNTQTKLLLQADHTLRLSEWQISALEIKCFYKSCCRHQPPTTHHQINLN